MSFIEAFSNITVGYVVSVVMTAIILPAFGLPVSFRDTLGISAAFTVVSLLRNYLLRRMFNRLLNSEKWTGG
jgi:hypothetical protein